MENGKENGTQDTKKAWENADLGAWVKQDLRAAIAMLDLLLTNKQLFNLLVEALNQWRSDLVKREEEQRAREKQKQEDEKIIQENAPKDNEFQEEELKPVE